MPHELTSEQNQVAIVNSIIRKIFNPCKYWAVTIKPFRKHSNHSVTVLFVASFYFLTFGHSLLCANQCFCSNVQCLITQCIFCSDTGIVFQVFQSCYSHTTTNQQSINIIHQTVPFLSYYRKQSPVTTIDIEGYLEPISPYRLSRHYHPSIKAALI